MSVEYTHLCVCFGQRNLNNLATVLCVLCMLFSSSFVCSAFAGQKLIFIFIFVRLRCAGYCERIHCHCPAGIATPIPIRSSNPPRSKVTKVNFCFLTFRIRLRQRQRQRRPLPSVSGAVKVPKLIPTLLSSGGKTMLIFFHDPRFL